MSLKEGENHQIRFQHFLPNSDIIQGSGHASWWVKKSICIKVKMPFDLKSQGHATRLVPSSLQITQSASQLSLFFTRKRKWKGEKRKR